MNFSQRKGFQRYRSSRGPDAASISRASVIGFTLIEVMIATGIFFMAVFAILAVVSSGLRSARSLQQTGLNAGPLASELALTNSVTEGFDAGDFDKLYPGMYQDYSWRSDTYEVASNGLFRVDFVVERRTGGSTVERPMSILLYRPQSQSGAIQSIFRRR